ncbi:glycosyltransferase [Limnothrix sp. FACHB-1083]|nr:glycosyltransferase [Limnothrix sp. FACHB-1083]MBD2191282.1 glycosyltransferase [Limnothrix sp. FACHB-1088]
MPSSLLISVCIPLYNKASFFEQTITSVLSQTYRNLEIIVSDNGSTDGSSDLALEYSQRDSRIKYYRLNKTISANENFRHSLLLASGEILKLQCADDYLEPDFISRMVQPLLKSPETDFSVCTVKPVFDDESSQILNPSLIEQHFSQTVPLVIQDLLNTTSFSERSKKLLRYCSRTSLFGCFSGLLFRRRCLPLKRWKAVEMGAPFPAVDWDFLFRLYLNHRGTYINEILEFYRYSSNSETLQLISGKNLSFDVLNFLMPLTLLTDKTLNEFRSSLSPEEFEELLQQTHQYLDKVAREARHHSIATPQQNKNLGIESLCQNIEEALAAYTINPIQTRPQLRELRKYLADCWLHLPSNQVQEQYRGHLGTAYRSLVNSRFRDEKLTDVEEKFVEELFAYVCLRWSTYADTESDSKPRKSAESSLVHPSVASKDAKSINFILAATLYLHPSKLSIHAERIGELFLPDWFVPEILHQITSTADSLGKGLSRSHRILTITNLYPPQELGGYGRSLADFAAGLQSRGHQIHVLTSDAPYLGCTPDREDGIDRRLQLWGTYEGQTQEFQDPNQIHAIVAHNDRILREVLAQVQPDLCLVGNISFLGPAVFGPLLEQQIPTIHHLGFAQVPYPPTLAPQHPLYHLATASEAVAQAVRDAGLTQLETSTIHPGALVRQFSRPTLPQRDKLRILYAGLVIQTKGPHTLLEALTVLQQQQMDFECTIAGNAIHADYLAALQQYLQQTGLVHRVRLVGHLDRSQLADCFAQHNVFVFPSIQPEAFGIVQVEAMAAGLTVLSTGVGGASEVIESGVSGLLFPAGDPIALAQALISLPQDPERWARLAATGQAAAFAKFDIERSIDQLELKFEELLRRKAELSSPMALSIPTSPATDPYTQWLCDRITNVVRVYGLDPNDQSTINLLRELRRQTAELWKAAPAEQLPDLYQGSVGQAYRALLHSGFQSQPLTGEEANYLQALTNQVSQHTVQHPVGLQAFLGVMLYLPAGKMKVDQAPVKLPAWLLSDYQSVFEPPGTVEPVSAPQPIAPPTSATAPLHQDMTFLNRLLGCANLYYIDPEETSIAEELRLIRQQVGQIWAQTPLEQLESLYKSEFGRRYLALLDSGYQNYPLLPEEESVVQELTGLISQGIDRYPGLNALLAIMMYLPPGKMQVRDAANRLPAWLLPDYQRIFEADQATTAPLVPSPQPTVPTAAPAAAAPPSVSQPPNLAEDMVFLNRFLGCSNLYEIDPEDGETVAELRQLRQRVAEFWLTVPPSQLEAVFNSELGRRYGMYLKSGFQREPLTDGERELLVKLAETAARGFEQPGGLNAFLGAMMYYAPGQMQVKDAATRLPGWLFPLYAAVFESEAQKKMAS